MLRTLLLFVIICCSVNAVEAQTRTRRTYKKEYYANGALRSQTKVKVTSNANVDLYNYYKRTTVIRTEFDSITGMRVRYTKRITKNGTDGKHCYEIYSEQIDYDVLGRRLKYSESKCDKGSLYTKDYKNGKVIFIHKEKRRRRRVLHA